MRQFVVQISPRTIESDNVNTLVFFFNTEGPLIITELVNRFMKIFKLIWDISSDKELYDQGSEYAVKGFSGYMEKIFDRFQWHEVGWEWETWEENGFRNFPDSRYPISGHYRLSGLMHLFEGENWTMLDEPREFKFFTLENTEYTSLGLNEEETKAEEKMVNQ